MLNKMFLNLAVDQNQTETKDLEAMSKKFMR